MNLKNNKLKRICIDLTEHEHNVIKYYSDLNSIKVKPFTETLLRNLLLKKDEMNHSNCKCPFYFLQRLFKKGDKLSYHLNVKGTTGSCKTNNALGKK